MAEYLSKSLEKITKIDNKICPLMAIKERRTFQV
jgi:hypothetical protein